MRKTVIISKLSKLFVFLILLQLFIPVISYSQNDVCSGAYPFCTGTSYNFPAGVNAGTAQAGPSYSCLGTEPNPAWYYLRIGNPGDLEIHMNGDVGGSGSGYDVDFVCWGPFPDYASMCGNLTGGVSGPSHPAPGASANYPDGNVVDCSYDPSFEEWCYIPGAVIGQYYMLMITNYSNVAQTIDFSQTAGSSTSDCSILAGNVINNGPLCIGQTLNLNVTSTPGATYSWTGPNGFSSSLQNPSIPNITAANAGPYALTISVGAQTSPPGATTVVINPIPVADAGAPQTICSSASATLTATGVGTYQWDTGPTTASISVSPAANITYTVTVTNLGCTASDNVAVTVNPLPVADAGAPQTICPTASATLTATGVGTYQWDTGPTTASITVSPAATTTYIVTVTNLGCTASDNMTVTVNSSLAADAGLPQTVCNGQSVTLTAIGGSTYQWVGGPATDTYTVSPVATTTYTVTAYSGGCSGTDNVIVTVSPSPTANAGIDVAICNGGNTTLNASGGEAYSWGPSTGLSPTNVFNPVASPTTSTSYTVTVTDGIGCTAVDNVLVTVNPIPTANAGADVSVCSGGSANLNATGGTIYFWSPGIGLNATNIANPIASPVSSTTYIVTVFGAGSCSATDDVAVTINANPTAEAGNAVSICNGESTTLTATGGTTYAWSNGISVASNTVSPVTTTNYTVTVSTTGNGCSATDNVLITVNAFTPPSIFPVGPLGFCAGTTNPAVLSASGGYSSYLWSNGATSQTINVTNTGTYWVIGTGANGCSDTSNSVQLQNFPAAIAPIIIPDGPTDFCEGDSIYVALSTDNPYYAYHWSSGSVTPTIIVTHSGNYNVTVTDSNGCTAVSQNTIQIHFIPKPVAYINYNAAGTYASFYDFSLNGQTYYWDFGDGSSDILEDPTHAYASSGQYTVTFVVSNACGSDTSTVTIVLHSGVGIDDVDYLSNFTVFPVPTNGDLNVMFDYTGINALEVRIFDMLGQTVYNDNVENLNGKYQKLINLSRMSKGIYYLQINTDKGSVNWKIVKD